MRRPEIHIIAGPNGSGKTTFAKEFLPSAAKCDYFVNVDLIAQGLSPLSPELANLQAGRIMLTQIKELVNRKQNFGFETTLAGKTYVNLIRQVKSKGYKINLYFLWVRNVSLSLKRIADRVKKGGHNVPASDVRRRYKSGIRNLFQLYQPLCDSISIIDNSTTNPILIAIGNSEEFLEMEPDLFKKLKKGAKT